MDDAYIGELIALAKLAEAEGIEDTEWFKMAFDKLCTMKNMYLYNKVRDAIILHSKRSLLDRTFKMPLGKDELNAINGPYKSGFIKDSGIEVGLIPLQLQMHSLIGGGAGFGKSTLVKIICQQILAEGKRHVIIIDPKGEGGDFRFLARDYGALLLRPDTIRCNPFTAIPNVPRDMLRELVCEVTADSFGVYDASEGILAKHIRLIFEKYEEPTLYDLIASIHTEKGSSGGRIQGYLDSLNTRLDKVVISLGKIIDCKSDYFSELYDKSVIFEIGELSGSAQRVLVPWIILKLVLYKIKNPTQQLSHLLVFDEAQANLFSRELFENRGRTSFMATLATQCRAFGLGIMVLAQNPCMKLVREIIANSCVKMCFQLGSGEEIIGMARHMGLTQRQLEAFYRLDRQEAICRLGVGGYTEPFLLKVHDFHDIAITTDEVVEMMKPKIEHLLKGIRPALTTDPIDAKSVVVTSSPDHKKAIEKNINKSLVSAPADIPKVMSADAGLSPDEQTYLRIVSTHPWRVITEVYSILGNADIMGSEYTIGQNRAGKIREKLIKMGYLETINIVGTGRSGKCQCDIPTEKANMDKVYKPRGDNTHGWWCFRVCEYYGQKGGKVKIADTVSGNEVDIEVSINGKRIGVEIVISTLVFDNLEKFILKGYFDEMQILCINVKKMDDIVKGIKNLREDVKEKVSVGLLKDYFVSF